MTAEISIEFVQCSHIIINWKKIYRKRRNEDLKTFCLAQDSTKRANHAHGKRWISQLVSYNTKWITSKVRCTSTAWTAGRSNPATGDKRTESKSYSRGCLFRPVLSHRIWNQNAVKRYVERAFAWPESRCSLECFPTPSQSGIYTEDFFRNSGEINAEVVTSISTDNAEILLAEWE